MLERRSGEDGFIVGVGADGPGADGNAVRYVIGQDGKTAVRVIKDGVEGYMLGDFSSGTAAGNLRAAVDENLQNGVEYKIEIIYPGPSAPTPTINPSSPERRSSTAVTVQSAKLPGK